MASRIQRPETAFNIRRSRDARYNRSLYPQHLKWTWTLPCLITMSSVNVEAAHIRYSDQSYGKIESGMRRKPDDFWAVPLEHVVHIEEQHAMNERAFWEQYQTDPLSIALALFAVTGNDDDAMEILRMNWRSRKMIDANGNPRR